MGYLKDIANQPNRQTFPGATFEIEGSVPAAQCSDAIIQGENATTDFGPPPGHLVDATAFAGFNLIGKVCTITVSPEGNTGNFPITANSDNVLTLTGDPGSSPNVHYYIHNGGELILLRDIPSFAAFIEAAGYSYTIKAGKLFTNMPALDLSQACLILFDPLT